MKNYKVKELFGDLWFTGQYGHARLVRVGTRNWTIYFWGTRSEEKIEFLSKSDAAACGINWVTRGRI
jgi:hypothetical protein